MMCGNGGPRSTAFFSVGGDVGPVQQQLVEEGVIEQQIGLLAELRYSLRKCAAAARVDPTIRRLLHVISDMIDEDCTSDLADIGKLLGEVPASMRRQTSQQTSPQTRGIVRSSSSKFSSESAVRSVARQRSSMAFPQHSLSQAQLPQQPKQQDEIIEETPRSLKSLTRCPGSPSVRACVERLRSSTPIGAGALAVSPRDSGGGHTAPQSARASCGTEQYKGIGVSEHRWVTTQSGPNQATSSWKTLLARSNSTGPPRRGIDQTVVRSSSVGPSPREQAIARSSSPPAASRNVASGSGSQYRNSNSERGVQRWASCAAIPIPSAPSQLNVLTSGAASGVNSVPYGGYTSPSPRRELPSGIGASPRPLGPLIRAMRPTLSESLMSTSSLTERHLSRTNSVANSPWQQRTLSGSSRSTVEFQQHAGSIELKTGSLYESTKALGLGNGSATLGTSTSSRRVIASAKQWTGQQPNDGGFGAGPPIPGLSLPSAGAAPTTIWMTPTVGQNGAEATIEERERLRMRIKMLEENLQKISRDNMERAKLGTEKFLDVRLFPDAGRAGLTPNAAPDYGALVGGSHTSPNRMYVDTASPLTMANRNTCFASDGV